MAKVVIGIPCYQNAPAETLADYMRFAYYIGRRSPHDYFLGIKPKSEQFRARNMIVEQFLKTGSDYLLMMDDDHVIDWEDVPGAHSRYGFVDRFIEYMGADPKLGIVGALYYQRGADCRPVLMREGKDGGFYWLTDADIKGELQEVAVQGGGCMLLRKEIFDSIPSPWFVPEYEMGTDLQICHKARAAGYKVACDTSVVLGHVKTERLVVTPKNRGQIALESAHKGVEQQQGIQSEWVTKSALGLYIQDVEEYIGKPLASCKDIVEAYNYNAMLGMEKHKDDPKKYYAALGESQLIRQAWFHSLPHMVDQARMWHQSINCHVDAYGLDVGCGSAPVTFDFLMRSNHRLDFIDIDGAGGYEFLKWRAKKRGVEGRCGWTWGGPYDYAFALDAIEHWKDWRQMLGEVLSRLKPGGVLLTNYFHNLDFENVEHVSMDHNAVKEFLVEHGFNSTNPFMWVKEPALKESAA